MSTYQVEDTQLTAIADAIRTKTGGGELLEFPSGFTSAIESVTAVLNKTDRNLPQKTWTAPKTISTGLITGRLVSLTQCSTQSNPGKIESIYFTDNQGNVLDLNVQLLIDPNNHQYIYTFIRGTTNNITIPQDTTLRVSYKQYSATIEEQE